MAFRKAKSSDLGRKSTAMAMAALLALATGLLLSGSSQTVSRTQFLGNERLLSTYSLPEMGGEMCLMVPASAPASAPMTLASALQQQSAASSQPSGDWRLVREPLRVIRDPHPSFSSVAVDMERGEVVAGDENLFQVMVYDRLANTPPEATMTEPKRMISGPQTTLEFVCGLHIDQGTGDIYVINADTAATMQVFTRDQSGNVPPARALRTGQEARGRGIAVDNKNQEIFISSQHNSAVVVFRKAAEGDEAPIRLLQGSSTRLANPHGLAYDHRNELLYITNHGQVAARPEEVEDRRGLRPTDPLPRDMALPGTGQFLPPSIVVHRRAAQGDVPPVRVIEGPRTQLNWPAGISIHEENQEIYVANDAGNAVLVFPANAEGDVAPIRVLQGPATQLDSPGGVFLDTKNNELWVSNYGNNSLNVYPLRADGNVTPLRRIRSAPLGSQALMIGNPGALAYDTKREEILVPN